MGPYGIFRFTGVKAKMFRKLVNFCDLAECWLKETFNVNMQNHRQRVLEFSQDNVPLSMLDKTIGVNLDIVGKKKKRKKK